jgi:hypothetical protein
MNTDLLKSAMRSPNPAEALRAAVARLAREGYTKPEVYQALESLLVELRAGQPSETEEDIVLDVMDAVSGWCHPGAQLMPE